MELCIDIGSGGAIKITKRKRCAPNDPDVGRLSCGTQLGNYRVNAADKVVSVKLIVGH